jgi:plasmid stabilization system protein ParE
MKQTVYWTFFAEKKLDDVYSYYATNVGENFASKIYNEIVDKSIKLEDNPKLGQIEPLLLDRKEKFRYLIHGNYKMIYWINDNKSRIEIVNLFDCRQNPVLLKKQTDLS